MIELFRFVFDTIVFAAAFALGIFIQGTFQFGSWFIPVSMLPCLLWACWRGAVPHGSLLKILIVGACLCAYFQLMSAVRQIAPRWSVVVDGLIALLIGHSIVISNHSPSRATSDGRVKLEQRASQ